MRIVRPAPRYTFKFYVAAVIAAGLSVVAFSVAAVASKNISTDWRVLAGLALLTGSFNIKVPGIPARISVSEAFVFAAVIYFGAEAATLIVILDALMMSLRLHGDWKTAYRAPFNIAAAAIAIWVSARLFFAVAGLDGPPSEISLERLLFPLLVLALSYFALNSSFVAIAMSLEQGKSAFFLWRTNFLWLALNYLGGASFAALLVSYRPRVDLTMLGVIIPLLVITYLTFRTSLGRVEDANRHVDRLNELYLSTIETLAMAVDAKDQITHGHIRRVQVYATELAKRLGISDQGQLKAIEAAALLHDMGKLAIPEYILNKPGKLTESEFDKMKRHSDIGADLLSAVRFPYPVVPIVRHHHENWDGSGYPRGISGTDIPIGARILSVVDCFDALTSDRPYRPRLTSDDAFRILKERRGLMYDPLVVDAFADSFGQIAPKAIEAGQQAKTLIAEYGLAQTLLSVSQELPATKVDSLAVLRAGEDVLSSRSLDEALEKAAQHLRELTPAAVCAMFRSEGKGDCLTCTFASGTNAERLLGLTIRTGERITGWVATNGLTICNSDPFLDLGDMARRFDPELKSALSTPISTNGNVLGVLTVYATQSEAFSNLHRSTSEQIASKLAECILQRSRQKGSVITFSQPIQYP